MNICVYIDSKKLTIEVIEKWLKIFSYDTEHLEFSLDNSLKLYQIYEKEENLSKFKEEISNEWLQMESTILTINDRRYFDKTEEHAYISVKHQYQEITYMIQIGINLERYKKERVEEKINKFFETEDCYVIFIDEESKSFLLEAQWKQGHLVSFIKKEDYEKINAEIFKDLPKEITLNIEKDYVKISIVESIWEGKSEEKKKWLDWLGERMKQANLWKEEAFTEAVWNRAVTQTYRIFWNLREEKKLEPFEVTLEEEIGGGDYKYLKIERKKEMDSWYDRDWLIKKIEKEEEGKKEGIGEIEIYMKVFDLMDILLEQLENLEMKEEDDMLEIQTESLVFVFIGEYLEGFYAKEGRVKELLQKKKREVRYFADYEEFL